MAAKRSKKTAGKKTARKRTTRKTAAGKKVARKASKARAARPAVRRKPASAVDPEVERLQRFIDVMTMAGAVELEMQDGDSRVRIRLREERAAAVSFAPSAPAPVGMPAPLAAAGSGLASSEASAVSAELQGDVFKSPMVGTFYRSPSPDADVFVKVGDQVTEERTLCIIEAMKVMNEIKAEMEGEVLEILAQNGQPIEFGQPLFVIKRS